MGLPETLYLSLPAIASSATLSTLWSVLPWLDFLGLGVGLRVVGLVLLCTTCLRCAAWLKGFVPGLALTKPFTTYFTAEVRSMLCNIKKPYTIQFQRRPGP